MSLSELDIKREAVSLGLIPSLGAKFEGDERQRAIDSLLGNEPDEAPSESPADRIVAAIDRLTEAVRALKE